MQRKNFMFLVNAINNNISTTIIYTLTESSSAQIDT